MKKADIGLIGLAVMGENLVMNMESKGFTVAVFNRTTEKVDKFVNGRAAGKNIIGCHSLEELVDNLEKPRKVFMMVKAGQAVDDMIEQLLPLLDNGDILIDGGNSHFPDTIRRTAYVESKGKLYLGTGVSGGEEGALKGPSMMPGGSPAAWQYVKPIFQAICAKVEDARRAATGSAKMAQVTSSRWYITALSTAICSSFARRISSCATSLECPTMKCTRSSRNGTRPSWIPT